MDGLASSDPLDDLQKAENLWFEDADVVFCAGRYKFRVYRGILSAQSQVFRDMLAQAQSEGNDGDSIMTREESSFTVITLPDDPHDLRRFFLALFDPSYYLPPPTKATRYVTVSILRLAHKYGVSFLMRHAVAHLDVLFPLEMEKIVLVTQKMGKKTPIHKQDAARLQSLLDMTSLTSTTGCQWILPSLLYILFSTYKISDIITHSVFGTLDPQSQLCVVRFHAQYTLETADHNAWVWTIPSENCTTGLSCRPLARDLQKQITNDPGRVTGSVKHLPVDIKHGSRGITLCGQCQRAGRHYQKALDERYWEQYPVVCGFKSWKILEKMRSAWKPE